MSTLTWLGHACWSIATSGKHLLIDPFLDDSPVAPVRADDVPADYILISHGHFDHISDAVKIALRTGATVVANYEICEWCSSQGVKLTEPMNLGGAIMTPFGRVKLTLAHHSSTLPDGKPGGSAGGFLLSLSDAIVYFACDTALFQEMALIGGKRDGGRVDVAVLPIGDRFTMGPDDAIEAIKLIRPKRVIPTHYNTWPPITQDAIAWAGRVCKETEAEPIVLAPGESLVLGEAEQMPKAK
jgi:L-ascorbate metabolism protein UlaG (beta-lactamase superfamily)